MLPQSLWQTDKQTDRQTFSDPSSTEVENCVDYFTTKHRKCKVSQKISPETKL